MRHVALHGMGRYSEAVGAFKIMLSKLEQSHDPHIRGRPLCPCRTEQLLLI